MKRALQSVAWAGLLVGAAALATGCSGNDSAETIAANTEAVNVTYYYMPG